MLGLLAAAISMAIQSPAAATPGPESSVDEVAAAESALEFSMPWWEKITVTVDDKGEQQSCRYETSYSGAGAEACDKEMAASVDPGVKSRAGAFSKVTFERRFTPGGRPDNGRLHPGDVLLGRQVMFLTLGENGAIESCHVVATSGDRRPAYGCDEARKEQFRGQAGTDPRARQAFMTILAYGHQEQIA